MEYYADCHQNGSLTYLFFPISQNSRNVASAPRNTASFTIRTGESSGSAGTFSPEVGDVQVPMSMTKPKSWWGWNWRNLRRGPAASARVALMGRVSVLYGVTGEGETEVDQAARQMSSCFLARHPDAKGWVPRRKGTPMAWWARFDPEAVYYVGGFGNEHYIGRIPLDMYQNATVNP
ncbi:pyridoxamine 5'-phosphate oxidase family protein [Ceratobasidium sp. AG-Ba]|nr:pyridoxamine 5'-phosphate oxidase family protein [Ceratobasidium sp. AG-Ba]QRW11306.1 pyridoxamine 5'-phosphate oxidase family protein [Ceratobasidium sp. AG-Ba]